MTESPPALGRGALPLLDIDVMRSFVAIAENASFTRAAKQVFRTPSALSMQIKGLEETLGRLLFVREAREVNLTPEGEMLLGYARRLLRISDEAVSRFLAPALEGTVRFGTPDDIGTRILPQVLTRFARSHPAVQVDVMTGSTADIVPRLDTGELDLALATVCNRDVDRIRGEIVHTEPLVWAARKGGVASQRSPLPLALASHGCAWRAIALGALDRAGVAYRIAYSSENCAGQKAAMLADLAVAPFPKNLISAPLKELKGDKRLPALTDYHVAMMRRQNAGPASEALAGYVSEAFRELRH